MAKVQIDNKKMWESLLQWNHLGIPKDAIISALKDQGLTINANGQIVQEDSTTEEEIAKHNLQRMMEEQKSVPPEIQEIINNHFDEMFDDNPKFKVGDVI